MGIKWNWIEDNSICKLCHYVGYIPFIGEHTDQDVFTCTNTNYTNTKNYITGNIDKTVIYCKDVNKNGKCKYYYKPTR